MVAKKMLKATRIGLLGDEWPCCGSKNLPRLETCGYDALWMLQERTSSSSPGPSAIETVTTAEAQWH